MFLTPLLIHRKLPVTARTAGSCDRPEVPPATPAFILLYFQLVGSPPIQGENCASMTVIDFRHTAPTRAASSLWRATDTSLSLFADTAPHTAKQGPFSLSLPFGPRAAQSGSGLLPGSPVIRRRQVRQRRTGALLAPPAQKRGPYFTYPHYSG